MRLPEPRRIQIRPEVRRGEEHEKGVAYPDPRAKLRIFLGGYPQWQRFLLISYHIPRRVVLPQRFGLVLHYYRYYIERGKF